MKTIVLNYSIYTIQYGSSYINQGLDCLGMYATVRLHDFNDQK